MSIWRAGWSHNCVRIWHIKLCHVSFVSLSVWPPHLCLSCFFNHITMTTMWSIKKTPLFSSRHKTIFLPSPHHVYSKRSFLHCSFPQEVILSQSGHVQKVSAVFWVFTKGRPLTSQFTSVGNSEYWTIMFFSLLIRDSDNPNNELKGLKGPYDLCDLIFLAQSQHIELKRITHFEITPPCSHARMLDCSYGPNWPAS